MTESESPDDQLHLLSLLNAYARALDFAEQPLKVDPEIVAVAIPEISETQPRDDLALGYLLRRHIHKNTQRLRQLFARRAAGEADRMELQDSLQRLDEMVVAVPAPFALWKILLSAALLLAVLTRLLPWLVGGIGGLEDRAAVDYLLSAVSSALTGDFDRAVDVGRRTTLLAIGQVILFTSLLCWWIFTVIGQSFSMKRVLLSIDWETTTVQGRTLKFNTPHKQSGTTAKGGNQPFSWEQSAYGLELQVFRSFARRPAHELQLDLVGCFFGASTMISLLAVALLRAFRVETLSTGLGILAFYILLSTPVLYYVMRLMQRHEFRTSRTPLVLKPFWSSLVTSRLFIVCGIASVVLFGIASGIDQGVGVGLQGAFLGAVCVAMIIGLGHVVTRRGKRNSQRRSPLRYGQRDRGHE